MKFKIKHYAVMIISIKNSSETGNFQIKHMLIHLKQALIANSKVVNVNTKLTLLQPRLRAKLMFSLYFVLNANNYSLNIFFKNYIER